MKNTILVRWTLASSFILCFGSQNAWSMDDHPMGDLAHAAPLAPAPQAAVLPVPLAAALAMTPEEENRAKTRAAAERAKKRWGIGKSVKNTKAAK
jgi:hypothetical protein